MPIVVGSPLGAMGKLEKLSNVGFAMPIVVAVGSVDCVDDIVGCCEVGANGNGRD